VLHHFRVKRLRLAFGTWRSWQQRKAWLAAVFSELQGRGHKQVCLLHHICLSHVLLVKCEPKPLTRCCVAISGSTSVLSAVPALLSVST
jgi:hypothetical protein